MTGEQPDTLSTQPSIFQSLILFSCLSLIPVPTSLCRQYASAASVTAARAPLAPPPGDLQVGRELGPQPPPLTDQCDIYSLSFIHVRPTFV